MIRGSDFLEYSETLGNEIESAYRIVMELQKRELLKVTINKKTKKPFIMWELKCTEDKVTENENNRCRRS